MKKSTKVKNVNGTSSARYAVSGLRDKYVAAGGVNAKVCQVNSCSNKATATGHVQGGGKWMLVPLCALHNHHTNHKPMGVPKSSLVPLHKVQK